MRDIYNAGDVGKSFALGDNLLVGFELVDNLVRKSIEHFIAELLAKFARM